MQVAKIPAVSGNNIKYSFNPTVCQSQTATALHFVTSGSAIAEGPREALVSRNPATTKHLT